MAAITIASLTRYFAEEQKSINRGENHFKSGHVEYFSYADGRLRGSVRASMKNKVYKVTVYLGDDDIRSTECECPRGAYKYSHAAALVIHAIHNLSRTDIECQWKKQKPCNSVKPVDELYPQKQNYEPIGRQVTDEDHGWLFERLKGYGEFTGLAWILSPNPTTECCLPIPTVEEIILSPGFVETDLKTDYLLAKLKISSEERASVGEATKGQRDIPAWHMLRKGRLTASNFGYILTAKKVTPSLVKRVLGEYDVSRVQAVRWGVVNENEGIKSFCRVTNLTVKETGLWLHETGILGASPDGLIGDNAVLEVKCPYTHRNSTIEEAASSAKFFLEKADQGYILKKTHPYWHQVQGQLYLTERQFCYFVVWTTKEIAVIEILKDSTWEPNLSHLHDFYVSHIIPRLVDGGL